MTIRVLLVDNRVMLRQGLRTLLETETDLEVVGEAGSVRQALDLAPAIDADLAALDLGLPESDGNTATQRVHDEFLRYGVVLRATRTTQVSCRLNVPERLEW
jgi:DNA-binding NarL/FixJ family response regulator